MQLVCRLQHLSSWSHVKMLLNCLVTGTRLWQRHLPLTTQHMPNISTFETQTSTICGLIEMEEADGRCCPFQLQGSSTSEGSIPSFLDVCLGTPICLFTYTYIYLLFSIHMYVCMYTYMYLTIYIWLVYVCMHACMHVCMYVCMYVIYPVYLKMYFSVYLYISIYIYIYLFICIAYCTHICIQIYIRI